jgi:hypothetical protein
LHVCLLHAERWRARTASHLPWPSRLTCRSLVRAASLLPPQLLLLLSTELPPSLPVPAPLAAQLEGRVDAGEPRAPTLQGGPERRCGRCYEVVVVVLGGTPIPNRYCVSAGHAHDICSKRSRYSLAGPRTSAVAVAWCSPVAGGSAGGSAAAAHGTGTGNGRLSIGGVHYAWDGPLCMRWQPANTGQR